MTVGSHGLPGDTLATAQADAALQLLASPDQANDVVELLRARAALQPDTVAYRYVDADTAVDDIAWAPLWQRAVDFAAALLTVAAPGDRALLTLPPGLRFIVAFYGCLLARTIVVPAAPLRQRRSVNALETIARDCTATVHVCDLVEAKDRQTWADWGAPVLAELPVLCPHIGADTKALPCPPLFADMTASRDQVALLQYTSGSTAQPKGVVLTHGNLLHNLEAQRVAYRLDGATRAVIWLPPHHDMGLSGGILQPLYSGFDITLMSPLYAMQRPLRWLQMISERRATASGGPTFGYAACIGAALGLELGALDLSSWRCAFVGAEPINPDTMEKFQHAFAPFGLARDVFVPSYGMAEATLLAACRGPAELHVKHRGRRAFTSCGRGAPGHEVLIVDPETGVPQPDGDEGEIWIKGPSVGQGYWNDAEKTSRVFGAFTADDRGPFLRSGDLGCYVDADLIVVGRVKDVIIVAGRKLHAEDIEAVARAADPERLTDALIAAVAVERGQREAVQLLIEVAPRFRHQLVEFEDTRANVVRAVQREIEIRVDTVLFARPGALPRTSSGKVRRQACKELLLSGTLNAGITGREVEV